MTKPKSEDDLILTLPLNHLNCFDNLSFIKGDMSDIFCIAATGGSYAKRTLYTTKDVTTIKIRACVAWNGINLITNRSDVTDRSILIENERITDAEFKTKNALLREFNQDLPSILGGIFNTISSAMAIYTEDLPVKSRMADFYCWGVAISEVLGVGKESFIEAYSDNKKKISEEIVMSTPVGNVLILFMEDKAQWEGQPTELYSQLVETALLNNIRTREGSFPKDAAALTKKIKQIKADLESMGYLYSRHKSDRRIVIIDNYNYPEVPNNNGGKLSLSTI